MIETVFYFPWEVNLILFIQSSLPSFIFVFFEIIGEVTSKNVLNLVFISIYLAYNKQWGKFILLSWGVAGVCCEFIKVTVARLRPYAVMNKIPSITKHVADYNHLNYKISGYSFPSGHTMISTNLFMAIPTYIKNRTYIFLGFIGVFIVAFSRVGLGVHYPTDTIAGFIIAFTIILVLSHIYDKVEYRTYLYLGIIVLSLVGIIFSPAISYIKYVATALGISLGFLIEEKYVNFENPKSKEETIIRLIGTILLFILLFVLIPKIIGRSDLFDCIKYSLFTFIMIAIYPLAFKKIDKD